MAETPATEGARGWGVYAEPKVLAMLGLGFSAGLPFPLVFTTLSAWLSMAGVSKGDIGLFALAGIAYSLKFVWSPLLDRLRLPGLHRLLGLRRSWMLLAQAGVLAILVAMSGLDPATQLGTLAALTVALAFFSATQDIAVDAWRIEAVALRLQGAMAAAYQLGYRVAMLVAGAGALYLADAGGWQLAYQAMAVLMGVGILTSLVVGEPAGAAMATTGFLDWLRSAVAGPFLEFFRRAGPFGLVLLLFIASYRISDMVLGVMAMPFYLELGFSPTEIANVSKLFGFGVTIAGAALGGVAVARFGAARPLVPGAILLAGSNLCFVALALAGADMPLFIASICVDNLAAGFTGTVFIAYLSGLTNVAYTATQYALFSSLMTLPGRLLSAWSGQVVEATDWVSFFLYTTAAGIPAVLLAWVVVRRERAGA